MSAGNTATPPPRDAALELARLLDADAGQRHLAARRDDALDARRGRAGRDVAEARAARRAPRRAGAWPAPTSIASSAARVAAACGTSRRITSSPSAPANSAPCGSWSATSRWQRRGVALGDVRRVGEDASQSPPSAVEQVGLRRDRRRGRGARGWRARPRARPRSRRRRSRAGRAARRRAPARPRRCRCRRRARARRAGSSSATSTSSSVSGPRDEHARGRRSSSMWRKPFVPEQVGDGLVPDRAAADEVLEGADRRALDERARAP